MDPEKFYAALPKEKVNCDLCDSDALVHILDRDRYRMGIQTMMCRHCGFLFTNPRPTQDAMNDFYRNSYRKFYTGSMDPAMEYALETHMPKRQWLIDQAAPHIHNESPRILDAGCGGGAILHLLRKKYPASKLFGVEPYAKYAKHAQNMSQSDVYVGDIDSFLNEKSTEFESTLDMIVMNHSFEHLYRPIEKLIALRKLLKPNGLVLIQVPNLLSEHWVQALPIFHIAHISHFTPVTMDYTFKRAGLKVLSKHELSLPVHNMAMTYLGQVDGVVPEANDVALPTNQELIKLYKSYQDIRDRAKRIIYVNPIARVLNCYRDRGWSYTKSRFQYYGGKLKKKVSALINPKQWRSYNSVGGWIDHRINHGVLKKIIHGKRILILGSGPSAVEFRNLPSNMDDVLVFTCNAGLRILKEKKFGRKVDLYLSRIKALSVDYPDTQELLGEVPCRTFIMDEPSFVKKSPVPTTGYERLIRDHQKDGYYLKKLIKPRRLEQVVADDVTWTSAGLRLLQYSLYFGAKEIYLLGIDLGDDGYFWGQRFIHKHAIDYNFMKIVSQDHDNVFSASENSTITQYIPYRSLFDNSHHEKPATPH